MDFSWKKGRPLSEWTDRAPRQREPDARLLTYANSHFQSKLLAPRSGGAGSTIFFMRGARCQRK